LYEKTNQRSAFCFAILAGDNLCSTSGDMGTQDLSDVYVRQLTILGARMGTRDEFKMILKLVGEGRLRPVIDKIFPLKDAAQAQRRMEEGKHIGKIVLEI